MAKLETAILAFNRGIVSPLALARVDLKRLAWSAETMENWMPRTLGSMMLRAGLQYIGATYTNLTTRNIPFVRSSTAKAIVELTANIMRIWVDDALVTRGTVVSAIANGTFTTDLTSWTDADESGATSAWVTGGYMGLTGNGTAYAIRRQLVTVDPSGAGHALRIIIERGPVIFKCGSTAGGDEYISQTTLETGTHSLSFTPILDFYVEFKSALKRQVLVDSVEIEAAGVMTLPTPWAEADLDNVHAGPESQSIDVMFVACTGYQQRRIERRNSTSWSVVRYQVNDGPYGNANVGAVTITPSALSGNITLTASAPLFKSTMGPSTNNDGSIFRIISNGQNVTASIVAENNFTNTIRVFGVDTARIFTIIRTGLAAALSTATLQRSLTSDTGPWTDVVNYTTDSAGLAFDDGLDNQIAWYRIGIKTGNYVGPGTIVLTLEYGAGSISGAVRITTFTSSTVVSAEVLTELGGDDATDDWSEGAWSDYRGWPSAVGFYEARLWWAGLDKIWASISDAFTSYDDTFEGDAGPISRSIGSGPVETINWLMPLQRLILGGQMAEFACRSSSFDEPLTPTNFNIKVASRQGSTAAQAALIDDNAVYPQRGGTRLLELEFSAETYNYHSKDLTLLAPEVCMPAIVRIGVQRQPDTRIHCVLSDGTVAVLVYDPAEKVACWIKLSSTGASGLIEDVVVLPGGAGDDEDQVYYTVKRTVNGSTVRHIEKWALESECVGGTLNKQADAFVTFTNAAPEFTVTGLTHLVGASVIVWQDGVCPETAAGFPKTYVVSGAGEITLDTRATTGVVGLAYVSEWKSAKLGQSLTRIKTVDTLGVVLQDTHAKGLYYGPTLTTADMDTLPGVEDGTEVNVNAIHSTYDEEPFEFDGNWDADSRLCLKAYAPRPCTLLATTLTGEMNG